MARVALDELTFQASDNARVPLRMAPSVPFTAQSWTTDPTVLSPATAYTATSGGSAIPDADLATDSKGRPLRANGQPFWFAEGRYKLVFSPPGEPSYTVWWEAAVGGATGGGGGAVEDAAVDTKGIAELSVDPVVAGTPIAVGDNDLRVNGPVIRPRLYGADITGATDCWTAFNTAVTAWKASGGTLLLEAGCRYLLSPGSLKTPWRIDPNTDPTKTWIVEWEPGAHVTLTTNMPGMFQNNRTADGQTFSRFGFIGDISIDAGNVTTAECALFGSIDGSGGYGALSQRVNWHDIWLLGRLKVTNLAASGAGNPAKGVFGLWIRHVYTNEGDLAWGTAPTGRGSLTQSTCTDIVIDAQIEIDGGDFGIAIAANLQRGETTGMRIKNYSGTTVNWIASKDVGGVDTAVATNPALTVDDWIQIGTGKAWERRKVTAKTDNGDGTGSLTINTALTQTHPTEDANLADKGSPMTMGANCNAWFDRIWIDGHGGYIKSGPSGYSSNIFLVGHGIGGRDIEVANIRLEGSGDNALEADTCLHFRAVNVHAVDAHNQAFLPKNFNVPQDQNNFVPLDAEQVYEYIDCTAELASFQPSATGSRGAAMYPGFNWRDGVKTGNGGASPRFGTVRLTRFQVIDRSPQFRIADGAAIHMGPDCSLRRLEGDVTYIKTSAADSTSATPKVVYLRPNTDCDVLLRVRAVLFGGVTNSQPTIVDIAPYVPSGTASGPNMLIDLVVELLSTLSGISNGSHHFVDFGNSASGGVLGDTHGRIACRFLPGWGGGDTQPKCVVWSPNGVNAAGRIAGRMVMDGWDTSRAPSGAVLHTFPSSSPSAGQRRIVHTYNNQLQGVFSNTTGVGQALALGGGFQEYDVTPGGSPWTWINETTVDVRVAISNGMGTTVDYSYDSGTTWQAGKLLNQALGPIPPLMVPLRPGEAIKITYTAAPTVAVLPRI